MRHTLLFAAHAPLVKELTFRNRLPTDAVLQTVGGRA
jgi:hypothetical protein